MIEGDFGRERLFHARRIADFIASEGACNLFAERLVIAKLFENGLMEEVLDIACVVEGR